MNLLWSKPLVIIEGNIGSGKTTAGKKLAEILKLRLLQEPVDDELLDLFYKDKDRWSFAFQMEMLHRRWAMQMNAASETMVEGGYQGAVLDRCLMGDLVFARALYEAGKMHKKEFEIYLSAMRNMMLVLFPPTVLLYLNARPETCLERIRDRGRPQEAEISLEYLQSIHDGYQRVIGDAQRGSFPWSHAMRYLVVPWDPRTVSDVEWCRTAEMLKETWEGVLRGGR